LFMLGLVYGGTMEPLNQSLYSERNEYVEF